MGQSHSLLVFKMRFLLAALVLLAGVWAQDTYKCPDGWLLEEDRSGCRCFLLSEGESVTKDDANILCAFHQAWVAELDHPGIEYWLKSVLLDTTEVGEYAQFWLGTTTTKVCGFGLTGTRPFLGLTGVMESLMITIMRTVWFSTNITIYFSHGPVITSGMTTAATRPLTIYVKGSAMCKNKPFL